MHPPCPGSSVVLFPGGDTEEVMALTARERETLKRLMEKAKEEPEVKLNKGEVARIERNLAANGGRIVLVKTRVRLTCMAVEDYVAKMEHGKAIAPLGRASLNKAKKASGTALEGSLP